MNVDDYQCRGKDCPHVEPPRQLIKLCDLIENAFGEVRIHSGKRCKAHNRRIGGSARSQHVRGNAIDFSVDGVPHSEIYAWLDRAFPGQFGIGLYDTHVHIDIRSQSARWNLETTAPG